VDARLPVCGVRNVDVRCPHEVSFVQDVPLEDVPEESLELLCVREGAAGQSSDPMPLDDA
jgi:hypothetical protein